MTGHEFIKKILPELPDFKIEAALEHIGKNLFEQDPVLFEKRLVAYFKRISRNPYIKK